MGQQVGWSLTFLLAGPLAHPVWLMAYDKLMDDLLLEIAAKLDYPSLMALSQASPKIRGRGTKF